MFCLLLVSQNFRLFWEINKDSLTSKWTIKGRCFWLAYLFLTTFPDFFFLRDKSRLDRAHF